MQSNSGNSPNGTSIRSSRPPTRITGRQLVVSSGQPSSGTECIFTLDEYKIHYVDQIHGIYSQLAPIGGIFNHIEIYDAIMNRQNFMFGDYAVSLVNNVYAMASIELDWEEDDDGNDVWMSQIIYSNIMRRFRLRYGMSFRLLSADLFYTDVISNDLELGMYDEVEELETTIS